MRHLEIADRKTRPSLSEREAVTMAATDWEVASRQCDDGGGGGGYDFVYKTVWSVPPPPIIRR